MTGFVLGALAVSSGLTLVALITGIGRTFTISQRDTLLAVLLNLVELDALAWLWHRTADAAVHAVFAALAIWCGVGIVRSILLDRRTITVTQRYAAALSVPSLAVFLTYGWLWMSFV